MQEKLRKDVAILLGCFVILVFIIQPWELYYLNDDFMHIPNTRILLRSGFMRPVPNVFLAMDRWLYGSKALGFFITSLLLHLVACVSVYMVVLKIRSAYLNKIALPHLPLIVTAFFLFYPYHAESLMWVISRVSIMATAFTLFSFYFYIDAAKSLWKTVLSWMFFVLALFSYESMWNAPLLFTLFSFLNIRMGYSTMKEEARSWLLMGLSFLLYIICRFVLLGTIAGDGYLEINENLSKYSLLLINLVKLIGRNFTPPFENSKIAVAFFLTSIGLYVWVLIKLYRKNKTAFYAAAIGAIGMVTAVVTASPLGIDTHYNEGERYLYYSSFFYCFFIAVALVQLVKIKWQRIVAAGICVLFVTLLADLQHNYAYSSSVTRTTVQTVGKYPNYKRAYFIDVPGRYKGSMIFRISLQDAVRWIDPQCAYDSIVVLSENKAVQQRTPFKGGEIPAHQLKQEKNWNGSANEILDSIGNVHRLRVSDDVLFYFRNDGIYKVNLMDSLPQKKK